MEEGNPILDGTGVPSKNISMSYYNYTINTGTYFAVQHDYHPHSNYTTSSGAEKTRDIAYLILFGLTSLVGLVGNSMVCRVVFRKGGKRNFTNLLLANLVISDVICVLIFFTDLLFCSDYLMENLGEGGCMTAKIVQMVSFQVSSVTMTIIALDRFLLVYYPLVRKHRRVPLHYLMPFVWIISFLVMLMTSPRYTMFKLFTQDDLHGGFIKCEVKAMFPDHVLTPKDPRVRKMLENMGLFWFPLIIIIVCYCSIARKVMQRNVGMMTTSQHEILLRKKWKTIKMLIASVAVFFICWAPLMSLNLLKFLSPLDPTKEEFCERKTALVFMAFWLVYSSSCCNPFVYWIYSKEFRGGLKDVWIALVKYVHCCAPGYCYCCCCGEVSSETEMSAVSRANSQSTNIINLSMKSSSLEYNLEQS